MDITYASGYNNETQFSTLCWRL